MDTPLISVILPVYNCETYIAQAINSILTQTYQNLELIVINDGSTDRSEAKILAFNDHRLRYYNNETNIGLCKTLNKAIHLSSGDYVARMDQDDISLPGRLEKQIKFLLKNPHITIVGGAINIIDENNNIFDTWHYPLKPEEIKHAIYKSCCFAHPTVMFLKNKITEIGSYNESYITNEDYELWIRLLKNNLGANLPDILLEYRIHASQISSNNVLKQCLVCTLIKKEIPVNYSADLKAQLLNNGLSIKEIETSLVNSFSFWIALHLKINGTKLAENLLAELKKQITLTAYTNKKILNSIALKISLKKKNIFSIFYLLTQRLRLILFRGKNI